MATVSEANVIHNACKSNELSSWRSVLGGGQALRQTAPQSNLAGPWVQNLLLFAAFAQPWAQNLLLFAEFTQPWPQNLLLFAALAEPRVENLLLCAAFVQPWVQNLLRFAKEAMGHDA